MSVRSRLTLLYSALFLASGTALLGITYFLFQRSSRPDLIVAGGTAGPAGPRALKEALANPEVSRYVRHAAERARGA